MAFGLFRWWVQGPYVPECWICWWDFQEWWEGFGRDLPQEVGHQVRQWEYSLLDVQQVWQTVNESLGWCHHSLQVRCVCALCWGNSCYFWFWRVCLPRTTRPWPEVVFGPWMPCTRSWVYWFTRARQANGYTSTVKGGQPFWTRSWAWETHQRCKLYKGWCTMGLQMPPKLFHQHCRHHVVSFEVCILQAQAERHVSQLKATAAWSFLQSMLSVVHDPAHKE